MASEIVSLVGSRFFAGFEDSLQVPKKDLTAFLQRNHWFFSPNPSLSAHNCEKVLRQVRLILRILCTAVKCSARKKILQNVLSLDTCSGKPMDRVCEKTQLILIFLKVRTYLSQKTTFLISFKRVTIFCIGKRFVEKIRKTLFTCKL